MQRVLGTQAQRGGPGLRSDFFEPAVGWTDQNVEGRSISSSLSASLKERDDIVLGAESSDLSGKGF